MADEVTTPDPGTAAPTGAEQTPEQAEAQIMRETFAAEPGKPAVAPETPAPGSTPKEGEKPADGSAAVAADEASADAFWTPILKEFPTAEADTLSEEGEHTPAYAEFLKRHPSLVKVAKEGNPASAMPLLALFYEEKPAIEAALTKGTTEQAPPVVSAAPAKTTAEVITALKDTEITRADGSKEKFSDILATDGEEFWTTAVEVLRQVAKLDGVAGSPGQGLDNKAVMEAIAASKDAQQQVGQMLFVRALDAQVENGSVLLMDKDVETWVNTQPAYVKQGFNSNDPKDVASVLNAYRTAKGKQTVRTAVEAQAARHRRRLALHADSAPENLSPAGSASQPEQTEAEILKAEFEASDKRIAEERKVSPRRW